MVGEPYKNYLQLFEEAQKLGATFSNLVLEEREGSLGLYVKDPGQPWNFRMPKDLLLPRAAFDAKTGGLKDDFEFPGAEQKTWLDAYLQATLKGKAKDLVAQFKAIQESGLLDWRLANNFFALETFLANVPSELHALTRIVRTYAASSDKRPVYVPFLEFIAQSDAGDVIQQFSESLALKGTAVAPCGRAAMSLGMRDALHVLDATGEVVSKTSLAFALPMGLYADPAAGAKGVVKFGRNTNLSHPNKMVGRVPKIHKPAHWPNADDTANVSFVLLANKPYPNAYQRSWTHTLKALEMTKRSFHFDILQRNSLSKVWGLYEFAESIQDEHLRTKVSGAARSYLNSFQPAE